MDHYGWNKHIWDIPVDSLSATKKAYVLAKVLFILASTCLRMSLLFFYLWLVKDAGSSVLRMVIRACTVANGILGVVCCLICVLGCR